MAINDFEYVFTQERSFPEILEGIVAIRVYFLFMTTRVRATSEIDKTFTTPALLQVAPGGMFGNLL